MTKLGSALAAPGASAPADKVSRLMAALSSSRVLAPITVPHIGITALMTIAGAEQLLGVEADVVHSMKSRGIEPSVLNEGVWELERAMRTLALVVLDDDEAQRANPPPLGSAADWGRVPKEVIAELWRMYSDLSELHDPGEAALDDETVAILRDALVKKNGALLRSFGARRLAAFLLTTAAPPSSSTTPESSPGGSSPAPSS